MTPTHGMEPCKYCSAAVSLIMRLHNEGVLSEGQVAKALGMDRVTVRTLSDTVLNNRTANR